MVDRLFKCRPVSRSWAQRRSLWSLLAGVALLSLWLAPSRDTEAGEARSKVFLDGQPVAVFFNDGDSFRVVNGSKVGTKARLVGFNTLESYGPVHQWGSWTAKEMFVLAKMATLNARRGIWKCESTGEVDTYKRSLIYCPGLAEDQIRKGLAHVMTVDDEPGRPALIAAQQEAIAHRRGIWAHGVPDYIMTSLHSVDESIDRKARERNYNRLVSTADGHSVKWKHQTSYSECQKVCHQVYEVDEARVDEVARAVAADPDLQDMLAGLNPAQIRKVIRDFARDRHINRSVAEEHREALKGRLMTRATKGEFGTKNNTGSDATCVVHVPFKRRYGGGKATCLK
ncbi:MAG TPA: hypothetical protein ENK31_04055 [Nannocystis exedens]|nr:hypothetical protein [Nannocystis exedens]